MKQHRAAIQTEMQVRQENGKLHLVAGSGQAIHGDLIHTMLSTMTCSDEQEVGVHLVLTTQPEQAEEDFLDPFPSEFP